MPMLQEQRTKRRKDTPDDKVEFSFSENAVLQRRLEQLTIGMDPFSRRQLSKLSETNKAILADFLQELTYKDNAPPSTKAAYTHNLFYLARDAGGKSFRDMVAMDVDLYLQSHQKPRALDPKQRWISTHNQRAVTYIKFFKWLYYPDFEPRKKRPKPAILQNVITYEKPEVTNVEAKHLWTPEEDRIFLKYCTDPRIAWYHTAADDTSCRPGELLNKRFADVKIKMHNGQKYGELEIGRGGKTKSRMVPLIRSLPYFIQLSAANPDPNSYIIRNQRSGLNFKNLPIKTKSLRGTYARLKEELYRPLLDRPDVPPEDKEVIKGMLEKPWNPYIRRHTALSEKAKYLNDYNLRLHAGWSKTSNMVHVYTHELGAESSREILAEHGIMESENKAKRDLLAPRYCPKCKEPNKPDAKFCVKPGCECPLTQEPYFELKAEAEAKSKEYEELKQKVAKIDEWQRAYAKQIESDMVPDPDKHHS